MALESYYSVTSIDLDALHLTPWSNVTVAFNLVEPADTPVAEASYGSEVSFLGFLILAIPASAELKFTSFTVPPLVVETLAIMVVSDPTRMELLPSDKETVQAAGMEFHWLSAGGPGGGFFFGGSVGGGFVGGGSVGGGFVGGRSVGGLRTFFSLVSFGKAVAVGGTNTRVGVGVIGVGVNVG